MLAIIGRLYNYKSKTFLKTTQQVTIQLGFAHKHSEMTERQKTIMSKGLPNRKVLPNVQYIIAVASGKGGVGKSTTSVNLALSLSEACKEKVGLLDLDVFGPSIPTMMNLENFQPEFDKSSMSMGFVMPKENAAIWRGPMVMSAVQRLLFRTAWPQLKYLIIDLPPGTGDTHLSISQLIKVHGAIIVSTPQDIALIDARRGVELFKQVNIPIVGLIQNMSVFVCPKCGHNEHLFGQDGVNEMAKKLELNILGDIPLDKKIRQGADEGQPIVVKYPAHAQSEAYRKIARAVERRLLDLA